MTPRTDWSEQIAPNEDAELLRYAEILRDLQRKHAARGGVGRALHRKGHGGVLAELRTRADLPAPYRVGIFAAPAAYRTYVRFSNGAGKDQPDRAGDVRGIALKIVGVPGKKLIPGLEDARTHDLLLIKSASTPFRDAGEFVGVVQAANNPLHLFPLMFRLGPGRVLGLLKKLTAGLKEPVTSMATLRYWSALPTRYGDYAARYSLTPVGAAPGAQADSLRGDLEARLAAGPLRFTLSAQLYVDPVKTPIEDASVDWDESVSPFVAIADLEIPQQDPHGERAREIDAFVEKMSFDPWHAPVEFRPLGNMMRARNHAYRLSTIERGAAPEPDGSESF